MTRLVGAFLPVTLEADRDDNLKSPDAPSSFEGVKEEVLDTTAAMI